MTFLRRLKLYGFGVGLGLIAVYFMFKGRYPAWLPQDIIMENIEDLQMSYEKTPKCILECLKLSEDELIKIVLLGSINFGKSETQSTPCKKYYIEDISFNEKTLFVEISLCDSSTSLTTIGPKPANCDCMIN